jgi:hypothetical protein
MPKLSPGPEREFPLERLKAALPLLRAGSADRLEPFGAMTADSWAATVRTMATFETLKRPPAPTALYTNQFATP